MSYDFLDHTSELIVRLRAGSFPDLVVEAGRAMAELIFRGEERGSGMGADEWREIQVSGSERGAMLVEWMNELIYLAETQHWAPVDLDVVEVAPQKMRIRARGVSFDEPFALVKAATLHGLFVREGPDGVEAEVTLDV
jgi:SHS2 domain-containing protein